MEYLWASLLLVGNVLAWCSTLFMLPGNWIIVALTALYAWLAPIGPGRPGVSWTVVVVLLALAALGELIEFVAGAAGAAKEGGSRRGVALSLLGAVAGSIGGALLLAPLPVVGPVLGALGGGALGAYLGAYTGETWKGRSPSERAAVSQSALIGRLLGTAGKLLVGIVMVVTATIDSFF